MNFSVYFLLCSAAILVVFAQQSNAGIVSTIKQGFEALKNELSGDSRESDTIKVIKQSSKVNEDAMVFLQATLLLRDSYIEGTNLIGSSLDTLMKGIADAKKSLPDAAAAKSIILKTLADGRIPIFKSIKPIFNSYGVALALSNEGAKKGLAESSEFIQKAGLALLDSLNLAESLVNQGIDAGGNAALVLLKSVRLNVDTTFTLVFENIQKSIRTAHQALRDGQTRPIIQIQIGNQKCADATKDSEGANAVKEINLAAQVALNRGANAVLVEKLRDVCVCQLGDLAKAINDNNKSMRNLRRIAAIDPQAAKTTFYNQVEAVRVVAHDVAAYVNLVLGDVALRAGKQLKQEFDDAVMTVEVGKIEVFLGIKTAGDLISIAARFPGDAPAKAIDGAAETILYSKSTFMQATVKAVQLLLSVI